MSGAHEINPVKESIKLYAKQLRTPAFVSYEKVVRSSLLVPDMTNFSVRP